MKRYTTVDKDFTGCDEEIAEALKSGKHILCYAWNSDKNNKTKEFIIDYDVEDRRDPYESKNAYYSHAIPIKRNKRIKSQKDILVQLYEDGYKLSAYGKFRKDGAPTFTADMFDFCGLVVHQGKNGLIFGWRWKDNWLEEI